MFFVHYDRKRPLSAHQMDCQDIVDLLMPFSAPDNWGYIAKDHALMVQCITWNTAESKREPAPLYDSQSRTGIVSWARLDNRRELAEALGVPRSDAKRLCDSEFILHAYLKWREDCIDHLIGDFAFVILDQNAGQLFCGRDHMGVRPFYYYLSDGTFFCATSLAPLIYSGAVRINPDEEWMAEYLLYMSMSFDRTPYKGILKLPPAHCLTVSRHKAHLRPYFRFGAEQPLKLKDSREYADAYREQLEAVVNCRLRSEYAMGSELSGGIDSSAVTALAAKRLSRPLTGFHAFGFANSEQEPQHILSVSQVLQLPYNHILTRVEQDHKRLINRSLKILGYPIEHFVSTHHEPFYQLAEKFDIRTLLSGFGGDEFVSTTYGYLVHRGLIVQHRFKEAWQTLGGDRLRRFLRLARLYALKIKTRSFSKPVFNRRYYQAWSARWPHHIVRPELIKRFNLNQRYFETARYDAGYTDLKRFTLEQRWQPFIPTRLENCTLMAAARKIEYRWPLLDIRLVRLFFAIPSEEHIFRGMGRYLHRRAVAGIVPDPVNWKKGKSMGNRVVTVCRTAIDFGWFSIDDLHPRLAALVDTNKLGRQIKAMPEAESKANANMMFQLMHNIRAAANLNLWLHACFPNDAI